MKRLLALLSLLPALALAGITADQGLPSPRTVPPWRTQTTLPIENVSAFGEIITTSKVPIVSLDFNYAINSFFTTSTTANGGTVTQANSMAVLQTSAAANGSAQLESKAAVRYIAGIGVFSSFTSVFTPCVAASQQESGLGDVNDGFFMGCQNATSGLFLRKGAADTFVAQSAFNLDHLDGTGPSGITWILTNLTLFKVEFGWHGSGPVKYEIFDVPNSRWVAFHVISAGVTSPRINNPTLPLHVKVVNTGNTTNLTVRVGSMGAFRESSGPDPAIDGVSSSPAAAGNSKSVTTELNLITLQDQTTVFGGAVNKVRIKVMQLVFTNATGGVDVVFRAVLNTALGGAPSFTAFDANTSVAATDTAGTTVTGGRQEYRLRHASPPSGLTVTVDVADMGIILNPGDTLTISAASTGGAQTVEVDIMWIELFSG